MALRRGVPANSPDQIFTAEMKMFSVVTNINKKRLNKFEECCGQNCAPAKFMCEVLTLSAIFVNRAFKAVIKIK